MTRALLIVGLLCGCSSASSSQKKASDNGYLLGAADAAKQLYWAKQALEAKGQKTPLGELRYYRWEDSGVTGDGRRLAPESVGVPVFIPAPVSSGADAP